VRGAVRLGDRQGVDVEPQRPRGSGPVPGHVGDQSGAAVADPGHPARVGAGRGGPLGGYVELLLGRVVDDARDPDRVRADPAYNPESFEDLPDPGGRPDLAERGLGMGMELATQRHRVQGHGCLISSPNGSEIGSSCERVISCTETPGVDGRVTMRG
jgi:hypothetical protein